MSTFAGVAASLCGLASRLLGWRPHEFWHATPSELVLALGSPEGSDALPPSRSEIAALIEKDRLHG